MSALRDWARLDARWYDDPVLRACAKQAPGAFVMWPVLVAMAKASSHVDDNPNGHVRISMDDLAGACCITTRRAIAALDALTEGDFVTVIAHRVGVICIQLKSFAKWQTPRKSKAESKANADFAKCRENGSLGGGEVGNGLISGGELVEPDIDLDIDVDIEKTNTPIVATTRVRKPRRSKPLQRVTDTELDARVGVCFNWYCDLFGKSGQSALALTQQRYDAIAWALTEFTKEQVAECLRGYHSDPWRREALVRHDIATLLKDHAQVEKGIDKSIGAANAGASGRDTASYVASLGYGEPA